MTYQRLREVLAAEPTTQHGRGASAAEIDVAIRTLGPLPNEYVEFLREYGWLVVKHYEFNGLGEDVLPRRDLLAIARDEHTDYGLPRHLIPIRNDGGGNLFCFDTTSSRPDEVVYWDHETESLEQSGGVTSSFSAWVLDCLASA